MSKADTAPKTVCVQINFADTFHHTDLPFWDYILLFLGREEQATEAWISHMTSPQTDRKLCDKQDDITSNFGPWVQVELEEITQWATSWFPLLAKYSTN
jgi:hypothetical protein